MAIKSLKSGAFEFLEKPFDEERLMNFVKRAVEYFNLKNQNKELETKYFSFELIGNSQNIEKIKEQIQKYQALKVEFLFLVNRIGERINCKENS